VAHSRRYTDPEKAFSKSPGDIYQLPCPHPRLTGRDGNGSV
jgi:hypothetical protein